MARGARSMHTAVLVSAVRTPIGSFQGSLSSLKATELGSIAIRGAIDRIGLGTTEINEVYMGNVVSAGLGQAPARQAALGAGLHNSTPCTLVNKVCASGLKAVAIGAANIMCGSQETIVAGGFESMSNIPYIFPKVRNGLRYGDAVLQDAILLDGLNDAYDNVPMGNFAELCAKEYGITREEQDRYATESYQRALASTKEGRFSREIVSITLPQKKGDPVVVNSDEEPTRGKLDKFSTLKPAFAKDGTVTAANASSLNDGAAAVVLMSEEKAKRLGLKPLARIRAFADAAHDPRWFTTAPSLAIPKILKTAGLSSSDVDYYEINEAFSVVSLANMKILNLDPSRVNVNGGAVALGHPIGCSGARLVATMVNVLEQRDATIGVISICNGGGGAGAMVLERM